MVCRFKSAAFSIIELLVVISIISVLLSILVPVLRGIRLRSRVIVCKSNLRQNYNCLSAYAFNNDGFWPRSDYGSHTNQFYRIGSPDVHGPLYYLWAGGYVPEPKTWHCPAGVDRFSDNWPNSGGEPASAGAFSGYQYRMFFACHRPRRPRRRRAGCCSGYLDPGRHSNLVLWADAFGSGRDDRRANHDRLGVWNVLFADSSVATRTDGDKVFGRLDLSWHQGGDWRVSLADGSIDKYHSVAFLWHFFDTGQWQIDDTPPPLRR